MARRTFQVVDITEILVHWHAGRSISEVAHSLGVDRNTVRKYIAPAVAAGIVPGSQPISLERWQELVRGWFPQLVTTELRHPRFGEIAPFHELIREQLAVNTAATIWQRLRDERGLQASIAFGAGEELFLAHLISAPPDFDQVLPVKLAGAAPGNGRPLRGARVIVRDRANTIGDRLRENETVAADLQLAGESADQGIEVQLEAGRECYLEEGELRVPAEFDQMAHPASLSSILSAVQVATD